MTTVQEIENAIRSLTPSERETLWHELPVLFPELNGDSVWARIIRDPAPRPKLSQFLDAAEAILDREPESCTETSEIGFDRHS